MKYVVELAVFVAVFFLGMTVFESATYAVAAALVITGPIEALWTDENPH